MTSRKHWTKYHAMKQEIFSLMMYGASNIEKIEPAEITIKAYYKGKRAVDTSNIDDKIIVDAIMHMGIISDDTPDKNPVVIKKAYRETGEDKLVVEVKKI